MKRHADPVDGLLLLNKPSGISSNRALQQVRRLLNARKAGHTGSLDPAATGMLPLCFGEATKVCAYLLDSDKCYRVTVKLGSKTDTGDADGEEVDTATVPQFDHARWGEILQGFLGESSQIPPMYSALKVDGKRLYELARKGETVTREPRGIRIDDITLLEAAGKRLVFRVTCSKGTYIRTLVEDIATVAGTLAHTQRLHREWVGVFRDHEMLDMTSLESRAANGLDELRAQLLPADAALSDWPAVALSESDGAGFCSGKALITAESGKTGLVRVYSAENDFLGVGTLASDGGLSPRRVFLTHQKTP